MVDCNSVPLRLGDRVVDLAARGRDNVGYVHKFTDHLHGRGVAGALVYDVPFDPRKPGPPDDLTWGAWLTSRQIKKLGGV